jgi:pimeloyl-ACP methyl ester carboxylesterase
MQKAITLTYNGKTLRGMEHIPDGAGDAKLPAVILYHGFTGHKLEPHRFFLKVCRALEAAGVACFRYDFLGSGESDGDFEEMTVSGEVAEASAILDHVRQDPRIDPTRINLLGMSMGGLVASLVAGDRPDDVHDLVLVCPAGDMYELIKSVVDLHLSKPDLQVMDLDGNLIGRAFGEDVRTLRVYDRARNYNKNVLLIHGTNDPTVPFAVSERYIETCYGDRAVLKPIEGADHTFNKHGWEREVIETIVDRLQQA